MFDGIVQFADKCRACGLDYTRFNVGDGPAAFLTLIIGAVLVGLALWLEVAMAPPFWVHMLLWIPLTVLAVLAGLRIAKAALLIAEYRNKAGEAGTVPAAPDEAP
ncbi:Cytochrome-c oxidase [Alteripontixanthobacter maritimus]|uniref:Cytochrome-c oxidase n=2 Tax=Alteripontixanthobacter maritimus TaxID=2161824 RepID=A0A369QB26_9SPHN|nr:Cytochrome-c oxidase [Alteripontixanthobacter maritimus]